MLYCSVCVLVQMAFAANEVLTFPRLLYINVCLILLYSNPLQSFCIKIFKSLFFRNISASMSANPLVKEIQASRNKIVQFKYSSESTQHRYEENATQFHCY